MSELPPLVLPVRPVLGWRRARDPQRVLALAVVPLVVVWALLLDRAPRAGDVVVLVTGLTVGPPAFWSLARVLRPHLDASVERAVRHALAAASTCWGTAVVVAIAVDTADGGFLGLLVPLASLGLVVTVPWGFTALLVRTLRSPAPRRPMQPPASSAGRTVLPR